MDTTELLHAMLTWYHDNRQELAETEELVDAYSQALQAANTRIKYLEEVIRDLEPVA